MLKSGLIFGLIALLFGIGLSLLSPLCVPCLTIFLGLAAGYVANVFDKPAQGAAVKNGALAGLIGGAGAMIGQAIGGGLNILIAGPEQTAEIMRQFGMPTGGDQFAAGYWVGRIGSVCCTGVFDIILMAGLGALGGLLWWQFSGKNTVTPPASV